jgi:hypothetical protein
MLAAGGAALMVAQGAQGAQVVVALVETLLLLLERLGLQIPAVAAVVVALQINQAAQAALESYL